MTVMTRKGERLLAQLVAFAEGDSQLVQQVFSELNAESTSAPSLEDVARRIQKRRIERLRQSAEAFGPKAVETTAGAR